MRTKASVNFVFPMPCVSRFKKIYEREWGKGGVKNIVWSLVGEGGGAGRKWDFSTTYTILGGWKNMFLLFSANTGSVALGPKYLNIWGVRSAGRAS